jgi:hypothetical protein
MASTGAEIPKVWGWIKRVFLLSKRIATLETRVTTLEQMLTCQPPDACPYCGERAMRLTEQSNLLGDAGKQWTWEIWTCEKCEQKDKRFKKL